MNADDLTPGTPVRIATDRIIANRSWHGEFGVVFGSWDRDVIPDWCLVKIEDGATIIVGFAPDELGPA